MALTKRGKYWYRDGQSDIEASILKYSAENYIATHFANARCAQCQSITFKLFFDDDTGFAARVCSNCEHEHFIGDSADYADDDELEVTEAICVCDGDKFEITVGVALYQESEDLKWLYLGCRCPACDVTGVYADWKNEYIGYRELLARV